jgi:MtN3 and saliva related transmembrane protein
MTITNTDADIVGYFGAVFLSLLLVPQVYEIYKLKKCDQISIYFIILEGLTSITWIIYGIMLLSIPIIVANSLSLFFTLLLIIAKYIFKNNGG